MAEFVTLLAMSLVWSLFFGELSLFNLTVGALIGLLLLSIVQRGQTRSFASRIGNFLFFSYRFFVELFLANVAIASLSVQRQPQFHPHIIAVPLRLSSDAAISLLASTITLLPGTVALGVSEDRGTLYAHAIGEADVEKARASVTRIETLIMGFMT